MNDFQCSHCNQLVFFENLQCLGCGSALAYAPDRMTMIALPAAGEAPPPRLCAHREAPLQCNWTLVGDDEGPLCRACVLTEVLPDLDVPGNPERWARLEQEKRRLLYSLASLDLPLAAGEERLRFHFIGEELSTGEPVAPVVTGHDNGLITINIAEADDDERERRRVQLHEPYRTVLGHLRHESGHFYWDLLIRDSERLDAFRERFGDERADYAEALKKHYAEPLADWEGQYVSVYASAHPWEDWAESWAHYLHMTDALETAAVAGLSLRPPTGSPAPSLRAARLARAWRAGSFDELLDGWLALTYLLNNLNRGLGLGNAYPFVLSPPVVDKLRFVHETLGQGVRG